MAKNSFIVEVTFMFPETACYIVNGRCPLDSEYEYIQDKASHDFQCQVVNAVVKQVKGHLKAMRKSPFYNS